MFPIAKPHNTEQGKSLGADAMELRDNSWSSHPNARAWYENSHTGTTWEHVKKMYISILPLSKSTELVSLHVGLRGLHLKQASQVILVTEDWKALAYALILYQVRALVVYPFAVC